MIIPDAAMPAVIACCFFTSLAFVVVCMRMGTRTLLVKNMGADDLLMILAMVCRLLLLFGGESQISAARTAASLGLMLIYILISSLLRGRGLSISGAQLWGMMLITTILSFVPDSTY